MRAIASVLLATAALGACGERPGVDEENASTAEVANAVREAGGGDIRFLPGQWQARVTLDSLEAPGMPAGMADSMKSAMNGRQPSLTCLTAEEAAKPAANFFTGEQGQNCRYDHFRMGGGKIDARLSCSERGGTQVMTMAGTYGPTRYQMTMTADMKGGATGAGSPTAMTMKMRIDAERSGECTGTEKS